MDSQSNFEIAAYYNNLGVEQAKNKLLIEAVSSFQKALSLHPQYEKSLFNLGSTEIRLGRYKKALKHLKQFLDLNDQDSVVYYKLAGIYSFQGKAHEAERHYKKALHLNRNYTEALVGLGSLYLTAGFFNLAIRQFEKILRIDANHSFAVGLLIYTSQMIADFTRIKKWTPVLDRLTSQALKDREGVLEPPFSSIARKMDLAENFEVAKSWGAYIQNSVLEFKTTFSFKDRNRAGKRINIGYLAHDFRSHPTSYLIFSLFGLHNRERFKVFTYSSGPDDKSFWRKDIRKNSDIFRDISQKSDLEAAKMIYEDRVDILIDLMGHISNSRLPIFALRPAPIQASWLAFAGTTGAYFIDYIVADKIVLPEEDRPFYTEQPVYLPCYQMYCPSPEKIKKGAKKSDFGLPEGAFIFTSFNQTYKIEPDSFSIWMEILKAVPGSVLWQLKANDYVEKNLKKEAKKRGVDPRRIIFAPRMPRDKHLERLVLADLELDTFTYNGHTTTSDALWSGVPVVTLKGRHFASRVSASLLSTIGLPELITHSKEDYKKLIIRLATHPEELRSLKKRLAKNKLTSSLFDPEEFTKSLEKLYEKMWSDYLKK